ncbi:MAG: PIN domain-containing protein [Acidimicrobiales bacterium]
MSDVDRRVTATIDTDVFIDLDMSVQPSRSEESAALFADWISDEAQLVITKEVAIEVNRQEDAALRKKQLERAALFPKAGETAGAFRVSKEEFYALIDKTPKNIHDISDANHVARTHAAGVSTFITRDDTLRSVHTKSAASLGVTVTTPGDFISALWSSINDTYAPIQLQNTHYSLRSIKGIDADELAGIFINPATGERKKDLARRLRYLISDTSHIDGSVVLSADGSFVALMVRRIREGLVEVPILRFASGGDESICRHIAHLQTSFARENSLSVVKVSDEHASRAMRVALRDEGYLELENRWWSVTLTSMETTSTLAQEIEALDGVPQEFGLKLASALLRSGTFSPSLEAELEQRFWPMKIRGASLPTFMVPIRAAFAKELFDSRLSQESLFRQMELGIFREQVYYRSPLPSGGIEAPARLLWYVKQQPGITGSGMIRACSYLFEVNVDRPRTLFRRNSRLGVYNISDVEGVAKRGLAMALRFGLTEELRFPVPLKVAKAIASSKGCLNMQLQSPWRLPDGLFEGIYERATHEYE